MADWDDWERVRRVGAPEFKASGTMVKVRVWTKGRSHEDWRGYFMSQVSQLRIDAAYDGHFSADRDSIHGSCGQDDPERYIEMLDSAIDYANTKFETDSLPNLVSKESQNRQAEDAAKQRQASLDELAKKLAKPEFLEG
jgi:hypothetical protein